MASHFVKIGADGAHLPADAAAWEAVLDQRTGLMWTVKAIQVSNGREQTLANAVAQLQGAGGFTDWRQASVEELFLLADRTRVGPAIDTDYFPECPSDWFWTSTPDCESPSGCAWVVYFDDGYSVRGHRGAGGFVRAVRDGK